MRRTSIFIVVLITILLGSCMTTQPDFMIDNSRLKHQSFDSLALTVLVLNEEHPVEDPMGIVDIIDSRSPSLLIFSGDPATVETLKKNLTMNIAVISKTRIAASRYTIRTRSTEGFSVDLDETHSVFVDLSDTSPMITSTKASPSTEALHCDAYEQTHAEADTLPVTIYYNGLLPLDTTDIHTMYAGLQGIYAKFAVPDAEEKN